MEMLLTFFQSIGSYLSLIRVADVLDVLLIAFLIYKMFSLFKSTQAERIFAGVPHLHRDGVGAFVFGDRAGGQVQLSRRRW